MLKAGYSEITTMVNDAVVPRVARLSATMLLNMYDERAGPCLHYEEFELLAAYQRGVKI